MVLPGSSSSSSKSSSIVSALAVAVAVAVALIVMVVAVAVADHLPIPNHSPDYEIRTRLLNKDVIRGIQRAFG